MGHGRRLACACALTLAAACGDNHGTSAKSGERLRLYWLEYEDGTRQVADGDLWDDERQEPCRPNRWNDGRTYCTPQDVAQLGPYYLDESCTQVAYFAQTVEAPAYVSTYEPFDGEIVQATLAYAKPETLAQYWSRADDGTCLGPIPSQDQSFYSAGRDVPRADLVELRTRESTGNGRVAVRATTSDDGFYLATDFVDRNLHAPCFITPFGEQALCVPGGNGEVRYRDGACRDAVLGLDAEEERSPAVATGSTCDVQVYAVGAAIDDAPGFTRNGDACEASPPDDDRWFTLIEHPVAQVPRTREIVAGRRLETIAVSIDGVRVEARQAFDTEIGEECTRAASPREPGVTRCVPRNVGFVVDVFADDRCTIPIEAGVVYVGRGAITCAGGPPRYARDFSGSTIIRELGGPRPTVYYRGVNNLCAPDVTPSYRYYDLGAAIPDTRWARGTVVRD